MSKTLIHIDDYVAKLLVDKNFLNNEHRRFVNNCYIIDNVEGDISPEILNSAIRKAKRNRKMRSMLTDILHYVDKNSVTTENFQQLLHFRGKCKETYLSNIAHADLAFYQMQLINRSSTVAFEAFAWLFDRVVQYDLFNEEDMIQILKDASAITSYGVQSCIDLARSKHGSSSKLDIAVAWVNEMKNKEE